MSGYVYLIRVGDLYRIGKTENLEKKIKKLKPDELLTSIMTKEPETLEARLLSCLLYTSPSPRDRG